jgi:hypothetical protein
MNSVLFIKENGHSGRCPVCGREERLIQVRAGQKIVELNCGLKCFLDGVFIKGTFLMANGFKPDTIFITE